jgi:hypothetical protein
MMMMMMMMTIMVLRLGLSMMFQVWVCEYPDSREQIRISDDYSLRSSKLQVVFMKPGNKKWAIFVQNV